MKQEQMKIWERFLKGLLVMTGILFIATGIGYLFRYLGFSEENIIIVYNFRGSDHCNHYGQQRMERMLFAAQCVCCFNFLFNRACIYRFSSYCNYG